jgi:hypothetical protein
MEGGWKPSSLGPGPSAAGGSGAALMTSGPCRRSDGWWVGSVRMVRIVPHTLTVVHR